MAHKGGSRATVESSRRKWGLASALTAVAFAALLALLVLIGAEVGLRGLMVGALAAVMPAPVYVAVALWLDRFEFEPPWMLALAFGWGATVAVLASYLIGSSAVFVLAMVLGVENASFLSAPLVAPVVEESAKVLGLGLLYSWKQDEFDGVVDGVVYAAMVGLGFAMTENILYYSKAAVEGEPFALAGVFLLRGVLGPFGHPLYTAMAGIAFGLAAQSQDRFVRWLAPLGGWMLAIFLHLLWNSVIGVSVAAGAQRGPVVFFTAYALLWVPIFLGSVTLALISLRQEADLLRDWLQPEVSRGLLTPSEHAMLSSVSGRWYASWRALRGRGLSGWSAERRLHHLAGELAFHRARRARGLPSSDAMIEADFFALRRALREEPRAAGSRVTL
jgi:RsiW-degrading membrane proteinase PrsW (M82 family)